MKNSLKHVVFSLVCLFFMWVCKTDTTHDTGNGTEQLPASTDVDLVIVNGRMVVKDSEFQKVWAGQPIRFPIEGKGRFEPANVEKWGEDFSVKPLRLTTVPSTPRTRRQRKTGNSHDNMIIRDRLRNFPACDPCLRGVAATGLG